MSLPPTPHHPEPWALKWSQLEVTAISEYGELCRKQALEEAALLCHSNIEQIGARSGRSLAPFPAECGGVHAGMTYAKAIKELLK